MSRASHTFFAQSQHNRVTVRIDDLLHVKKLCPRAKASCTVHQTVMNMDPDMEIDSEENHDEGGDEDRW